MRYLHLSELSYIAGGNERARITTSIMVGLAMGAKHAFDHGETDFNGLLTNLTFGVISGTIGTQILSYLFEHSEISYEKYQERERRLYL